MTEPSNEAMTKHVPSKREALYILEMVEAELIDFSYIHPWADQIIAALNVAPAWLCELAVESYRGGVSKILCEYPCSEPFEAPPDGLEKFHVACLWIRYERRELSWATFLRSAGEILDAANGDWDCETPYHFLNVHEDAYFSRESEEQTKKDYLADHDLAPWIVLAKEKFEPFRRVRRAKKALQ